MDTDYVGRRHFVLSGCYATFCFRQRVSTKPVTKRHKALFGNIPLHSEALCNARLMQLIPGLSVGFVVRWLKFNLEANLSLKSKIFSCGLQLKREAIMFNSECFSWGEHINLKGTGYTWNILRHSYKGDNL